MDDNVSRDGVFFTASLVLELVLRNLLTDTSYRDAQESQKV